MLQSEKTSEDTERLIEDVGTTLLSKMVVDQEPYRVQTNSLDMVLNRLSPNSLENKTDFEKKDEGFKLPFNAITDGKAKGARFIDSVVRSLYHALLLDNKTSFKIGRGGGGATCTVFNILHGRSKEQRNERQYNALNSRKQCSCSLLGTSENRVFDRCRSNGRLCKT